MCKYTDGTTDDILHSTQCYIKCINKLAWPICSTDYEGYKTFFVYLLSFHHNIALGHNWILKHLDLKVSSVIMLYVIIGITMDDKINFEKQVASICKSSFYHIRNIARLRRFLSGESTKALRSMHLLHTGWITATRFFTACRRIRLKSFNVFRTLLLV